MYSAPSFLFLLRQVTSYRCFSLSPLGLWRFLTRLGFKIGFQETTKWARRSRYPSVDTYFGETINRAIGKLNFARAKKNFPCDSSKRKFTKKKEERYLFIESKLQRYQLKSKSFYTKKSINAVSRELKE